mmetsp:Transcript_44534/g.105541  ORF Transcript_44534/g.105541 Transcript_44534/m.105541 type:complete len:124 (-) Transcript_44534:20-391(-)
MLAEAALACGALDGVLVPLVGLYGFVKVKSKPSIIFSSIFGALLILMAVLKQVIGLGVVAALLAVMFGQKAFKKGEIPEKMVSLLGPEKSQEVNETSKKMFLALFIVSTLDVALCAAAVVAAL